MSERRDMEEVLARGGDMGAFIASIDWTRTPLGAMDGWPSSLRTMLSVILRSRFPLVIYWTRALIFFYNDAYRPLLGDKHPRAMGQPAAAVWPESWDVLGPKAQRVLDGGLASWDEHLPLFMDRKGYVEESYWTFSYSPVPDDSGEVGGILVAVQETTEQVQDERQLEMLRELGAHAPDARSAEAACRAAAAILAANDADVPFALFYLTAPGGTEARLVASAGMDGYRGPGMPAAVSLSAGAPGSAWPLAAAGRGDGILVVEQLGERFGPMPGGRWRQPPSRAVVLALAVAGRSEPYGYLVCGVSPLRQLDKRYERLFELTADQVVTAIASAEAFDAQRRRADALTEIDRAKTIFFSDVSHEFRTPLTLILGPLEDALASSDPTLAGEPLRAAHRNTLRLLKLVNNLLDFARLEAGRIEASYEPVELAAFTADLASTFRSAMERAGLAYEVSCEPLPEAIHVDRDMWEKIVLNLLSNAFKFTFEGRVRVALRGIDGAAELTVSDTGSGIPANELPRMFQRFHRVPGSRARTYEGSGIGLALVHQLVRLHGGSIAVASELGRGTTFTVTIPAGSAHLPADHVRAPRDLVTPATSTSAYVQEALRWLPSAAAPRPAPDERDGGPPGRVLLADDNADMRDYVRRLLEPRCHVHAVADGEAALAALEGAEFDVVLTDIMMPRLDGYGLLRAIREDPRRRATPVIMLSARADDEARVEGLEAGADDYLVKPFGRRDLVARVAAQVELTRLRRAAEAHRRKLEVLLALGDALRALEDPAAIADVAARALARELAGARVVYRDLDGGDAADAGAIAADEMAALLAGRSLRVDGPAAARLVVPLLRSRRLAAVLEVHATTPHVWSDDEVTLFAEAAERTRAHVERARAETALRALLAERETLLREIHHRVKNNLEVIDSLLQLQAAAAGDERLRVMLADMSNRIHAIAESHRLLHGAADLANVDVKTYAEALASSLSIAGLGDAASVRTIVDAEPLQIDLRRAIPFGLILNELISNAFKHAYPGGRTGRLVIHIARDGDAVELGVTDDGVGLREPLPAGSLGLMLVRILTEQLHGSLSLRSGAGTSVVVRFPLAEHAASLPSS
jgi:signal transduction histidine kinase